MINHFIRMAFRRIWRRKGLSLLKIAGLGLSIAASIWLIRYVEYQWQFDQFHTKGPQLYRVANDQFSGQQLDQRSAMTYAGIPVALNDRYEEVLDYVRLGRWIANDVVFQHQGKAIRDKDFFFVDPSFLELFSYGLVKGDPTTALKEPNSLILSEKNASLLFGEEDPIGKEVILEGRKPYTVTGVSKDSPAQSHLQFGILASYSSVQEFGIYRDDHLEHAYVYAYVLLAPEADTDKIAASFSTWVNERKKDNPIRDQFELQPLTDIHLYSSLQFELGPTGNGSNLWILLSIALLTLLLAWINHFNIYTASSIDHIKALGIRKVVGATRRQIANQLLVESLILCGLGIGSGLLLAYLGSTIIENQFQVYQATLGWQSLSLGSPLFYLLVFLLLGVLISILIPPLLLSSFRPVFILNRGFKLPGLGVHLQKMLTIVQFGIIIGLLAATTVIYQQTLFMQDLDPGFAIENKLVLRGPLGTTHYENLLPHYKQFKNKVESFPEVSAMTLSREVPGNTMEIVQGLQLEGKALSHNFGRLTVGPGFFEDYELGLVGGAYPSKNPDIKRQVVINESAMKLMGVTSAEQLLNKTLFMFDDWEMRIVAVIKDHHHRSLHHPLMPIIYDVMQDATEDGYFTLSMNGPITRNTIEKVKATYNAAFPNTVFDYFELAEHYSTQYQADIDFRRLNLGFTVLGFFIACLGLFGLSLLVFQKRIKEVGIRKVLGASVPGIVRLLVSGLLGLVIWGLIFAVPFTWYLLNRWLSNFSYHIDIQWWVFALAGGCAIFFAILTMSYQSIRAALTNPVEVIKSE